LIENFASGHIHWREEIKKHKENFFYMEIKKKEK